MADDRIRINRRPVTFSMRGLTWLKRLTTFGTAVFLVAAVLGAGDRSDNLRGAGVSILLALLCSDLLLCYVALGSAANSAVARIDMACPNCGQPIATRPKADD